MMLFVISGWSPDGRQIVFRSRVDGSVDIFIFDDFHPEWNPQRDVSQRFCHGSGRQRRDFCDERGREQFAEPHQPPGARF